MKKRRKNTKKSNTRQDLTLEDKTKEHISSSWYFFLKWIAMITMVVDHTAYLLFERVGMSENTYTLMRTIGRLAFPLFCYMLVECFFFTKNKIKHFGRILGLAFISEIPFNIFKEIQFFTLASQNVCFELALGFALIAILNCRYDDTWLQSRIKSQKARKFFLFFWKFDALVLFGVIATFLNFDYLWRGLLLMALLLKAKKSKHQKIWQFIALAIFGVSFLDLIYIILIIDLILIYAAETRFTDKLAFGRIGTKFKNGLTRFVTSDFSKAVGKAFYPVHLIILIAIRIILT